MTTKAQTGPKSTTLTSYQARMARVTDHIYQNLDEDINIDRLAEVAHLSPYHWHRINTAMQGETVAATVRRLRLQRAADRLANSETPIARIADQAGYNAVESFTRAFKSAYERSPADYRSNGSHAAFKAATRDNDMRGFPIEVETVGEKLCAGVQHRGSYMQIDRAMGELFGGLTAQNLIGPETAMLALFHDDADMVAEDELRSVACSPIPVGTTLAAPLEQVKIRGGSYARLRYQGPYSDMKDAYRWLFGVWLPESGFDAADAPAVEAYLNDPREVAPADLRTDILLPVEQVK